MNDYFWREFAAQRLWNRFPDWVFGLGLFREYIRAPEQYGRLLSELRSRLDTNFRSRGIDCPRLFISHRQTDEARAIEIAALAREHGFFVWLDVEDPVLAGAVANPYLIAILIEMALLNCSHVIALMTPATKGSAWVPYEYGRVKTLGPISSQASAWVAPGLRDLPEYLLLGPLHRTQGDIAAWLDAEMQFWPSRDECVRARSHRP